MVYQDSIEVQTPGRGSQAITAQVAEIVVKSGIASGLCNVFIHHTSASLMLTENADPQVRGDIENFLARLAPDGDPQFEHVDEGPDDMPAHIRTLLTESSLTVPVEAGKLLLGTWQGLFLYEHRHAAHRRRITVTVIGE
ncbi:MAG: secondary thiamine-phosphate synthase enzyme YjbQ [Gammaproteobacteria bacterium]